MTRHFLHVSRALRRWHSQLQAASDIAITAEVRGSFKVSKKSAVKPELGSSHGTVVVTTPWSGHFRQPLGQAHEDSCQVLQRSWRGNPAVIPKGFGLKNSRSPGVAFPACSSPRCRQRRIELGEGTIRISFGQSSSEVISTSTSPLSNSTRTYTRGSTRQMAFAAFAHWPCWVSRPQCAPWRHPPRRL